MKTADFQFESQVVEADPFPIEEENSEVYLLMKRANSLEKKINLSDLINREGFSNIPKAFTPRAKKIELKF